MSSKTVKFSKDFFCESISVIRKYSRIFLAVVLCAASVFSAEMLKTSVNTFNIFDGKTVKSVHTVSGNLQTALNCVSLESEDYTVISAKREGNVTDVVVEYVFPVYVMTGGKCVTVKTGKATVEEILGKAGFKVDKNDSVTPAPETVINDETFIYYSDVEYVDGSYIKVIPGKTKTVYSNKKLKGTLSEKKGTDGLKQVFYTEKLVDGKSVEKVIKNTVVIKKPSNGQKTVGTKVEKKAQAVKTSENVKSVSRLTPSSPVMLDKNGNPVNYKKKITVEATGYTYTGHKCATGVSPKPGYIAVNPKVIPYGTKMYIKTSDGKYIYGYAVAADTGGFIRKHPNNVDLFFPTRSSCVAFGRRAVEIYFI